MRPPEEGGATASAPASAPAPAPEAPAPRATPSEPIARISGEVETPRYEGQPPREGNGARPDGEGAPQDGRPFRPWQDRGDRGDRGNRSDRNDRNGRRGRRPRGRGRGGRNDGGFDRFDRNDRNGRGNEGGEFRDSTPQAPPQPLVVDGETTGWFDPARDAGFVRRPEFSYLNEPGDAYVPAYFVRQFGLRRGDAIVARTGHDHRGRIVVAELVSINGNEPQEGTRRSDFQALVASYPERHLRLETGSPAKGGPELTRRAIDLIAPIGFGQRALIVAPARAGKTMLMQAITEGIAQNHPTATLLILLVDERPEEVSEAISWGVGEVVASSFDQPAKRHVEVVEMVIERARRLVEMGQDVVIVLDSLTRMARAFNTAERGTGRTLSGGLDTSAMARPKAFFGSARNIAPQHGGGSLTIIATALVETGSRMDDVIFEEFKGTGNCEIKLDRSLAEKRIFPAFDIATSGTRREEKLYKAEQIDKIYTLRRGLQQMPPQAAMEWLIKRIAGTVSNDALLAGL
ncbi:MAG: transcription termination factor Rho [Gemmatimonadaceae bacterium]